VLKICIILSPVSNRTIVTARQLFTGEKWVANSALWVREGRIEAIEPTDRAPQYDLLVPSFIDLQIYGAYGRLFSVFPDTESLSLLHRYCLLGGAFYFLPTVATNTPQVFSAAIRAVRTYWEQGGQGCLGLHLEGPWLNPLKRGAHVASLLRTPSRTEVIDLLKEGEDVIKLITLAPEVCDPELIGMIRDLGIRVSAGHSNATFRQGSDAFKHGVSLATHLFNAMSPLQHRDPGMVGAIFCADNAMASIIPDGHHVNWAALQIAKKQLGERLFVITDAVTDTSQGPYLHQLVNDHYEASGVLSGSSLTMLKALNNLIHFGAIEPEEALRMCSLYPARALGIDDKLGRLAPGYQAQWTALSFHEKNYTLTLL
jgi:N-acetylglucosamine-6-phosphate deacetylase